MEEPTSASRRIQVLTRLLQPTCQTNAAQLAQTSATYDVKANLIEADPAPKGLDAQYSTLLTTGALQFVADLVQTFDKDVDELHWQRLQRKCHLRDSSRLPSIAQDIVGSWKVGSLPQRLLNRHLDLGDVSPANRQHFTLALGADVQGIQVDFDDGHCPTWRNQLIGLHNVYLAVHNLLPGAPSIDRAPVLMLRPRAWNMTEHHVMVNGKEVPGPLFDFGILVYHNAHDLVSIKSGPFFYLSKVEGSNEAKLWNDVFSWTEQRLRLAHGTIKACVLIENIFSSFELDEILFALKDHSLGLNCGIWDYAASIISKFGDSKEFVLPDRNKYVNMDRHFLKSYMQLVVRACHRRGAHATGGMAALLVHKEEKEAGDVIRKVCHSKLEEIKAGVDGFMVYDIKLVSHINDLWRQHAPPVNQLSVIREDLIINGRDLLQMPAGGVTFAGLKHNIAVAVLFIRHWLDGIGHFFYLGAVEDSATAEISRSQIWQWIRHQASMEDHPAIVTKTLVNRLTDEFLCNQGIDQHEGKLRMAKQIFMEIVSKREFPEFLTTYLNDSHIFKSIHH